MMTMSQPDGWSADNRHVAQIGGITFPMTEWEGGLVVEARSYLQMKLPHQCIDQEMLFPHAQAAEEPGDCDVAREEHLWWDSGNVEEESEEEEDAASLVACLGMTMKSSNIMEPNIAMEAAS